MYVRCNLEHTLPFIKLTGIQIWAGKLIKWSLVNNFLCFFKFASMSTTWIQWDVCWGLGSDTFARPHKLQKIILSNIMKISLTRGFKKIVYASHNYHFSEKEKLKKNPTLLLVILSRSNEFVLLISIVVFLHGHLRNISWKNWCYTCLHNKHYR